MRHEFVYNGMRSSDYGLIVSGEDTWKRPQPDVTRIAVPGRNGDLIQLGNRYQNVDITYHCGIERNLKKNFDAFNAALLSDVGYHRLEDTYHPECYRMGVFESALDPDLRERAIHGEVDITFNCKPQRFLKSGEYSDKAENFPYQRTKIVDFTSEYLEPPTEEQLRARAERYIRDNDVGKPKVSLKVSFVALHQTQEYAGLTNIEHINLCDTVTVVFPALDISTKAKVVLTVFDSLQERYDSIEIGSLSSNLGSSLMETASEAAASAVSQAKEASDGAYATKDQLSAMYTDVQTLVQTLFGQDGGRIITITDADNRPIEHLVLIDGQNYRTAERLYRFDYAGLRFTKSGYEGTYTSILDRDGYINAARVNGRLGDEANIAYWYLQTGRANFTSTKFTLDNKTVPAIADERAAAAVSAAVTDTIPGMISDGIAADVPDMISDAIEDEMPGVAQRKIYELVPGMVRTQVAAYDEALDAAVLQTKLAGLNAETVLLPTEITDGAVTAYIGARVVGGVLYPTPEEEDPSDTGDEPSDPGADDPEEPGSGTDDPEENGNE